MQYTILKKVTGFCNSYIWKITV